MTIEHGGQLCGVASPRQRAVLVALLLRANRSVGLDTLVDLVWGDPRPKRAEAAIRSDVSRLRKILPEPVLHTTSCGYLLQVAADSLDLVRFQRLVEYARRVRDQAPAEAAAVLGEALALWRGPALADLGAAPIQEIEAPYLEELRLAAIEDLVDAELCLGHHAELVVELHGLVARHPLRERMAAQLVLALNRCGRTAEAQAAYERARDALAVELGAVQGQFRADPPALLAA